jgi:hypothetical protein
VATTITFTDTVGAATLKNGKSVPADRFASWTPISRPFGDSAHRLSDAVLTMFRERDDFGASFELRHIPVAAVGGIRLVEIAERFIYHLLNGGACAINTGDASASAYPTCGLMPGTTPTLSLSNPATLEYTLSVAVINIAGSPVRMVCRYV